MVQKGQFLERPTLIPVQEGLVLEGLSHRGTKLPPLLIVPPLLAEGGSEGGSMDHVVAAEIAWAVAMAGFPTLRFNFRGVGASQGEPSSDAAAAAEDVRAALAVVQQNAGTTRAALVALGSACAPVLTNIAGEDAVVSIALVSPPVLDLRSLARSPVPVRVLLARGDARLVHVDVSQAAQEGGGALELIDSPDAAFLRNLPQVGRSIAAWLASL
jgi:alpha/beta superfamily hydrolase